MTFWPILKTYATHRGIWLGLLLVADALLIGLAAFAYLVLTLPRLPDDPDVLLVQSGINIYAESGELLYTFNQQVEQVRLDQISPHFLQAVLATEDREFYHHRGYSLRGMAGALIDNVRTGRKTRGGSTITQQIVKNIFLTREKSYLRKAKEILLATQLETMFERHYGADYKHRLLEIYINGSFYGTNAYGVADAARTYFGKSPDDLSLHEAALLAGLPNAPSALNPFRQDRTQVMNRVAQVLARMEAEGFITGEDRAQARSAEFQFASERAPQNRTPYFVETIKSEITRIWGSSALSFGGLDVHTTLDLRMQQAAERAMAEGLTDLDARLGFSPYTSASSETRADYVQGALLCLDPRTGRVKAMIGGRDIFTSYYNRATQARRQPGSGFKPFVYLAAFESGDITPVSLFIDEPRTYTVNRRPWTPRNFRENYLGLTTAAQALVQSANATTVQIAYQVGPERIVNTARRMGVQSPLHPYPSIALGAQEVTLLEIATAYGTLSRYGFRVEPTFIRRITDSEGKTVYEHRPNPVPVLDPVHAYLVINLLQHAIDRGTGRSVRTLGFRGPAAGKTGTTNDNTDAWFTGFTPDLVASVWIGFDSRDGRRALVEKRTRQQITGGNGAAPIWAAFMKAAGTSDSDFYVPDGIAEYRLDLRTGIADTLSEITIAMPEGIMPNTPADTLAIHVKNARNDRRLSP